MEKETSGQTAEAEVQAQPVAPTKPEHLARTLSRVQIQALPKKNRRLVAAIREIEVCYADHFRQMGALFNVGPEEAETRWRAKITELLSFADASQVFNRIV